MIARLPEAWIAYAIDSGHWLAPTGAISRGGRLAIPVATGGTRLRWQVYDLHHPEAAPIVIPDIEQDVEQIQAIPFYRSDMRPSVFWGPDERLAIPWYRRRPPGLEGDVRRRADRRRIDRERPRRPSADARVGRRRVGRAPWWRADVECRSGRHPASGRHGGRCERRRPRIGVPHAGCAVPRPRVGARRPSAASPRTTRCTSRTGSMATRRSPASHRRRA